MLVGSQIHWISGISHNFDKIGNFPPFNVFILIKVFWVNHTLSQCIKEREQTDMPQPIQPGSYTALFFQQLMLDIMKAQAGAAAGAAPGGQLSAAPSPAASTAQNPLAALLGGKSPTASTAQSPLSLLLGGKGSALQQASANQGALINSLSGANITGGSGSASDLSQLSASDPNLFAKIDQGLATTMSTIDSQLASVGIGLGSGILA